MRKALYAGLSVTLLCTGCAKAPVAWRIQNRMLVPPGTPRPVVLKGAKNCPSSDAIPAQRKGSRTILAVDSDTLGKQPPGWLAAWAANAEESGCVTSGAGPAVAERLLESAPQSLNAGYRLMHADHARSGYVDLGPANRLEVVTPILRKGSGPSALEVTNTTVTGTDQSLVVTAKTSDDLLGVETAWYAVRPEGITPVSAQTRIQGVVATQPGPAKNLFAGLTAGAYRLVYKSDQTSVIQMAASKTALQKASADACDTAGVQCVAVPRFVAVNPYLAVMVNGQEVSIPVGSALRTVIRAAGKRPEEVMATLRITKRYNGKMAPVQFEPTKPDVLDLVMTGNEAVVW
jgi:hypothetical protein